MASTYSNLKIQLMATGENSTTWGDVTNINLGTAIEEAIAGSADVVFASSNVTLNLTDTNLTQPARNLRLRCTGTTGGATRTLTVPSIEKPYIIHNDCANNILVKTAVGAGMTVPAGKTVWVYNDGVNIVDAVTHLSSLSTTDITANNVSATNLTANSVVAGSLTGSNISNSVLDASNSVLDSPSPTTNSPGFRGLPQNTQSSGYTLTLADSGKHIYSTNTALQTITVPTNAAVPFTIGTRITIVNMGTSDIVLLAYGVSVYPNGSTTVYPYPVIKPGSTVELLKTGTNTWNSTYGTLSKVDMSYLVVAGGGGGGLPGGGGAGGLLTGTKTLEQGTLTIAVGGGGAGVQYTESLVVRAASGSNSSITGIPTAIGGGGGGGGVGGMENGLVGGSGGGGGAGGGVGGAGTSGQGFAGGNATSGGGGGGGGAGGAGSNGGSPINYGGNGGAGVTSSITGTPTAYAGGGGGGGASGAGVGVAGGGTGGVNYGDATSGTANTGGGGGGIFRAYQIPGSGGSGIVVIASPIPATSTTGSPTVITAGGLTIYKFTSSGTITW